MIQTLIQGWTLGLATGTTCLATCAPIYLPYLLTEKRSGKESFSIIMMITLGRFFSYTAFGAAFGFVGSRIPVQARQLFTGFAYILLSIYLILTVFRIRRHQKDCQTLKWMKITRNPFLLGVLTGISFCPAFLIAVSQAIEISGILGGILLFIAFFVGTSIFILPMTFLGSLSRINITRKIALIASLIVAVFFIYKGAVSLIDYRHHYLSDHSDDSGKISGSFLQDQLVYFYGSPDREKADKMIGVFQEAGIKVIGIDQEDTVKKGAAVILARDTDLKLPDKKNLALKIIVLDLVNFETETDFRKLLGFLQSVYFKYDPAEGYEFPIYNPPSDRFLKQEVE